MFTNATWKPFPLFESWAFGEMFNFVVVQDQCCKANRETCCREEGSSSIGQASIDRFQIYWLLSKFLRIRTRSHIVIILFNSNQARVDCESSHLDISNYGTYHCFFFSPPLILSLNTINLPLTLALIFLKSYPCTSSAPTNLLTNIVKTLPNASAMTVLVKIITL